MAEVSPHWQYVPVAGAGNNHCRIAYFETGDPAGEPVLLLHEFALFSRSFVSLTAHLPPQFNCICPDIPGFGYTEIPEHTDLSMPALTTYLAEFIRALKLKNFTLIGHGIGGEIAFQLAQLPEIAPQIRRIAILGGAIAGGKTPELIANIGSSAMSVPIVRMIHSGFLMRMMLRYGWAPSGVPDSACADRYADMLRLPHRGDTILEAARAYLPTKLPPPLSIPVLVIHGAEDPIVPVELAYQLAQYFAAPDAVILPGCGHFVPDEQPDELARIITAWITGTEPHASEAAEGKKYRFRILKLFDRWHFGTLLLICILKFLQLLRYLGVKAEKHGWRKLSGIFLKNEYSKFMIGCFRLTYSPAGQQVANLAEAKNILVERLHRFIDQHSELHWEVLLSPIAFRNRRGRLCDIMEAEMDRSGVLTAITPHFDPREPVRINPQPIIQAVIAAYNSLRRVPVEGRINRIAREVKKNLRREYGWDIYIDRQVGPTLERIMTAAFLYFEQLPEAPKALESRRFRTPEPRLRHPGWGLLCIVCRFTADYREADLWWQFNHVSVDGAPMQDLLNELKEEWGTAGELVFPPLHGDISLPATVYCGDGIFRARFYMDFRRLLALRHAINSQYDNAMNGPISLAGLLMWGIAQHPAFREVKMLLPVDWYDNEKMRQLGLLVIRPTASGRGDGSRRAFLAFAREMNRHLNSVRCGKSEMSEFLALCSMLHPVLYYVAAKLFPLSLGEVVGTMGLSIIRQAEIFITPQTDWQINGFLAIGSTTIPTRDGRQAGAVSVCGTRKQIRAYFEALRDIQAVFSEIFP